MLIVITGSYISKLAFAVRYDKSESEKSNHLEAGVFWAKMVKFRACSEQSAL
ncbi:hypothetical protein LS996_27145 (plasmid) [Bacillus cereus]|uniref:hypothetical protein n=1 Tax=Bacillus cereus group TaxID=86661 RepID=UPI0020168C4D|nr:hypothetical protein [Bacillus thuringiensis]MDA2184787.1 hypothetical protein [Bacillus cereus]